ncbi:MAG: hypothetical protein ACREUF_08575, partial [Solimonas sp.]
MDKIGPVWHKLFRYVRYHEDAILEFERQSAQHWMTILGRDEQTPIILTPPAEAGSSDQDADGEPGTQYITAKEIAAITGLPTRGEAAAEERGNQPAQSTRAARATAAHQAAEQGLGQFLRGDAIDRLQHGSTEIRECVLRRLGAAADVLEQLGESILDRAVDGDGHVVDDQLHLRDLVLPGLDPGDGIRPDGSGSGLQLRQQRVKRLARLAMQRENLQAGLGFREEAGLALQVDRLLRRPHPRERVVELALVLGEVGSRRFDVDEAPHGGHAIGIALGAQ